MGKNRGRYLAVPKLPSTPVFAEIHVSEGGLRLVRRNDTGEDIPAEVSLWPTSEAVEGILAEWHIERRSAGIGKSLSFMTMECR